MNAASALLLLLVGAISRESFPLKSLIAHLSMKGVDKKTRAQRVSFNLEKAWRYCGTRLISTVALPPAAPFEPRHRNEGAHRNQTQSPRITPGPAEFGHEVKIHAVHARDQRRRDADDGNDGEHFEDVVLLRVDEAEIGVEQKLRLVRERRLVLDQRLQIVPG